MRNAIVLGLVLALVGSRSAHADECQSARKKLIAGIALTVLGAVGGAVGAELGTNANDSRAMIDAGIGAGGSGAAMLAGGLPLLITSARKDRECRTHEKERRIAAGEQPPDPPAPPSPSPYAVKLKACDRARSTRTIGVIMSGGGAMLATGGGLGLGFVLNQPNHNEHDGFVTLLEVFSTGLVTAAGAGSTLAGVAIVGASSAKLNACADYAADAGADRLSTLPSTPDELALARAIAAAR